MLGDIIVDNFDEPKIRGMADGRGQLLKNLQTYNQTK